MGIVLAVLSGYMLALAAPGLHRLARGSAPGLFALLPLGLTLYFGALAGPVASGEVRTVSYPWVPSLGVNLSFSLDGLSLLFALLISGIGTLIVLYTGGYLGDHPHRGRFYAFLLMFMASMLGLVLSSNVLTLFVFWELTSLSSYLLIGFDHQREEARAAALQALLVTGGGGLALLAGLLLLGQAGGSLELSHLLLQGEAIRAHALYLPCLLLILLGAFTKSAQFPFHFWLPAAMEAPTPVSAYLHSATMVKAGIYLLARLSPALGGAPAWSAILSAVGVATMLVGGYLALYRTDLKRILAYSTISALGTLVLLLGVGTSLAATAALVFLLAHALYKGALFMIAGAVDHETGTRDIEQLGGLRQAMPITATVAVLASVSLAGLGPVFSFIGKEMLFEAVWEAPQARVWLVPATALAGALFVAVAGIVGIRPFFGKAGPLRRVPTQWVMGTRPPHEAPPSLWSGPALLAAAGLVIGLLPGPVGRTIISPALASILGRPEPVHLALWHGWNPALALSGVSLAGGVVLYFSWAALRRATSLLERGLAWGPARFYELALAGLNGLAVAQTRLLQSGYLRYYLLMIIAATVGLGGYTLISMDGLRGPVPGAPVGIHELALAGVIAVATLAAVFSLSRLGSVVALGMVGYGLALLYILYGAPDLAMTQFLIETLTVLLFVLVFYHLPPYTRRSGKATRARDAVAALTAGALMTALVLATLAVRSPSPVSTYYVAQSQPAAHGRNIVNVILVDFRGIDTLGEITVLAVAGIGVYALLKLRRERKEVE